MIDLNVSQNFNGFLVLVIINKALQYKLLLTTYFFYNLFLKQILKLV